MFHDFVPECANPDVPPFLGNSGADETGTNSSGQDGYYYHGHRNIDDTFHSCMLLPADEARYLQSVLAALRLCVSQFSAP